MARGRLGLSIVATLALAVGFAGCAAVPTPSSAAASATETAPSVTSLPSAASAPVRTLGATAYPGMSWQAADLEVQTAPTFHKLVPIEDKLYLIASTAGTNDPTEI